jgi:hypothetical protein
MLPWLPALLYKYGSEGMALEYNQRARDIDEQRLASLQTVERCLLEFVGSVMKELSGR